MRSFEVFVSALCDLRRRSSSSAWSTGPQLCVAHGLYVIKEVDCREINRQRQNEKGERQHATKSNSKTQAMKKTIKIYKNIMSVYVCINLKRRVRVLSLENMEENSCSIRSPTTKNTRVCPLVASI